MTNTTAAIMAIPAPLEPIRLVGDEDKHATLLFFGETNTLPDGAKDVLTASVKTAADMLFWFNETVQGVQRLGPDNPPALVAMLSRFSIGQVRNLFMMNPDVKSYLSNTDQFPEFTPHITLGYPDFADEAILRALMENVYRVKFNRLAVWWNDERIEFDLNGTQGTGKDSSLAMSSVIENFLTQYGEDDPDHIEHHGIRGMKWGVRRPVNPSTGLVARTSSADQITQDRIASKLAKGGTKSLSNADIQAYTRRLQLQQDLSRALATQSAADKAKADGFIKSFVKKQASGQANRVANKAIDVAIEKALESAGIKLGKRGSNPDLADLLVKTSTRLQPKKK